MARKSLQVGVAALFGAAAVLLTPVIPAALAQVGGPGCGANGNPDACATISNDVKRSAKLKDPAAPALYAAQGFNERRDYCQARKYALVATERVPSSRNAAKFELAARARLELGRAYAGLASTAPNLSCTEVESWTERRLLDAAGAAFGAPPSREGAYYTAFAWHLAQVHEAMGGDFNRDRAIGLYADLSTFPTTDRYAVMARQRYDQQFGALCSKLTDPRTSRDDVRATIQTLSTSSCVADGYLRLAQTGSIRSERISDYSQAVQAFGNTDSVAGKRGRARMEWADLLDPNDGNAPSLRRQAARDFEIALRSPGADERASLALAYANSLASLSSTYENTVNSAFLSAETAAGSNTLTQCNAYAAHALYRRRTGQSTADQDTRLQQLRCAGADAALTVRLAENELARGAIGNRFGLQSVADNPGNATSDRAMAYYLLAADGLKRGLSVSEARDNADKARPLGGDASERYLAMSCLAHIREDLIPDERGNIRENGPAPLCGGSSAEARFLEGVYRLAIVRHIAPNTSRGAAQIDSARVAFDAGLSQRPGTTTPTFSVLAPGLTVEDLLKYGKAQALACLGPNTDSGIGSQKAGIARAFFETFRATCR